MFINELKNAIFGERKIVVTINTKNDCHLYMSFIPQDLNDWENVYEIIGDSVDSLQIPKNIQYIDSEGYCYKNDEMFITVSF